MSTSTKNEWRPSRNYSGSWAEPTCAVGKERWGEEADGAIGESRISLAADEGQSHGHGNQGLQRVDGDGG